MILWTFKLINSVRKAIAGRRHPSQLAWGLALGCLLGLIPHGNLLAVVLVFGVLSLRVNHAMAALTAVLVTLVAPKMDPMFHDVGTWFFSHPTVAEQMARAWQLPLLPWTDLNNTVVMGSFLVGLVSVFPVVMLSYPIFRSWSLTADEILDGVGNEIDEYRKSARPQSRQSSQSSSLDESTSQETIERIDSAHATASQPHRGPAPVASSGRVYDVRRVDQPESLAAPNQTPGSSDAVKKTEVSLSQDAGERDGSSEGDVPSSKSDKVETRQNSAEDQEKIDEALSYLLRQLRDSKAKDAA